ncbi:rod shape-determining protein MreC [Sulfuriflexus mobilis]|uniref:rod shape-determining protein MreC n=1 Tax=Sulfuriflexus mobilis TaxID=1811807 RepID=UPI000F81DD80|nr:rod shape-determining protein MreC [Sulfuriflexus mobilis]
MKSLFSQGPLLSARLILFVIISIVMMTMDHRYQYLENLRSGLSLILEPLRQAIDLPFVIIDSIDENISTRAHLLSENEELRTKNLLLKGQLQKFSAIEAENMRLRTLLDSSFKVGDKVLIAELLRVDLDPFTRQIVINKGSNSGVYIGQPLLDADGIIGQVIHVSRYSSIAMLITDPSHALPIQMNRTGQRAIAVGTGRPNELELLHIPSNTLLQEGDLLVSSGLGGRFPAGYPVARVSSTNNIPGRAYLHVIAEPTAHIQRSREVLLVWPAENPLDEPMQSDVGGSKG